jgi:hypothetical protein
VTRLGHLEIAHGRGTCHFVSYLKTDKHQGPREKRAKVGRRLVQLLTTVEVTLESLQWWFRPPFELADKVDEIIKGNSC